MSHFEPFSPIASLSDANCDVGHLDSFEPIKIPDLCSNEFSGMSDVDSCVDNNPDNVCSADKLNSATQTIVNDDKSGGEVAQLGPHDSAAASSPTTSAAAIDSNVPTCRSPPRSPPPVNRHVPPAPSSWTTTTGHVQCNYCTADFPHTVLNCPWRAPCCCCGGKHKQVRCLCSSCTEARIARARDKAAKAAKTAPYLARGDTVPITVSQPASVHPAGSPQSPVHLDDKTHVGARERAHAEQTLPFDPNGDTVRGDHDPDDGTDADDKPDTQDDDSPPPDTSDFRVGMRVRLTRAAIEHRGLNYDWS